MAETTTVLPLKRRKEEQEKEIITQEEAKRQKLSSCSPSYNQLLCPLDDADNDLTSLIATLHQEVSIEKQNAAVLEEKPSLSSTCSSSSSSCAFTDEEYECDKENVMKHLSEASDDELGIPNTKIGGSNYDQDYINGFSLLDGFGDGLWELEDEAANYYTLLQSELFL